MMVSRNYNGYLAFEDDGQQRPAVIVHMTGAVVMILHVGKPRCWQAWDTLGLLLICMVRAFR